MVNPKIITFSVITVMGVVIGYVLSFFLVIWPIAGVLSLMLGSLIAKTETRYGYLRWSIIGGLSVGMLIISFFFGLADIAFLDRYFGNALITAIVTATIIPTGFLLGVFGHDAWYWMRSKQPFLT